MAEDWNFRKLLLSLDQKIVKGNNAHRRLLQVAISEGLTPVEIASEDFLKICDIMERKGKLSPDNLSALIKIFPEDENKAAFNEICATRDILSGKDVDASSIELNPIRKLVTKKRNTTELIGQKAVDDRKVKRVKDAEKEIEMKMKCEVHVGERAGIVCVTCSNQLLCPQCIDDHTKGHDLQSLKKVASQIQQQLNNTSTTYSQILSDIRLDIRATQALQKKQYTKERQARNKINAQRQLLHQTIDASADKLLNICEERKQKNLSALQDRKNVLSSQSTEITNDLSEIEKILQSKNYAEVIKTPPAVKSIKVKDILPTPLEKFDFYTSQINKQSIDTMVGQMAPTPSDFPGSLRLNTAASLSTLQNTGSDFRNPVRSEGGLTTVSTINSNTSDFAEYIHHSVPGHAWVRWSEQNEIQLTDRQGHVKQKVKFTKEILGITTASDNRLLVCGWDEKCIYQVVDGNEPSVYFSTALHPTDICITDNGDVLVAMMDFADFTLTHNSRRIVSRYNSKGQHLSDSAEYDRFGGKLFVLPHGLSVNNTNTAVGVANVTSDTSSHLVLLDSSLNLKLRYDGKVTPANKKYKPDNDVKFYVQDHTFTDECNILMTEQYSNSILLLDSDCQLLKNLWKDDLQPISLCIHNDGELWCGFYKEGGGVIKVIKQSTHK